MADFCQFRICIKKGVGQETGVDRTMLHVTSRTSKYWSLILYLIFVKYIPPHVYKMHWLLGQVEQTLYVNCAGEFDFATLTNNEPHVIGCFSYFCNIFVWGGFLAKITFTKISKYVFACWRLWTFFYISYFVGNGGTAIFSENVAHVLSFIIS